MLQIQAKRTITYLEQDKFFGSLAEHVITADTRNNCMKTMPLLFQRIKQKMGTNLCFPSQLQL